MKRASIEEAIKKRILLLDGAMGTMIQSYALTETDFRGMRFALHPCQLQGNNDILVLTRPDVIKEIHLSYLEAGADIVTTNTFNAQRISMEEYQCEEYVQEINREAVRLAREAADLYSTPEWPRFVVATVGPTNRTCSISPDVNDPSLRTLTFDELSAAYYEQLKVLLQCKVDAVMFETIFDTLNVKAGIYAFLQAVEDTGVNVPLMLSVTVSDKMGRTLSGQTLEAFWTSVAHAPVFSVGLNCSFGPFEMLPFLRSLSQQATCYISAHPNAGLPNSMGGYDLTSLQMAEQMKPLTTEGLVNIIGGCCGTTPSHIKALKSLLECKPHEMVLNAGCLSLSGLENLRLTPEVSFVNVGERCNVAGSRKFLRLIKDGNYLEALQIARKQVEDGAMVLDINMDDGLLNAEREMTTFLNLVSSDPDICKVPVMIDSSNWDVVRAGLKCLQGKSIVNSISLKGGEAQFVAHAREIKRFGAAVVVMAFDELGQADTFERKIQVCHRAYRILVDVCHFPPDDIIFDPNILTIATGIPEHDRYALDFLNATDWIRKNLPGVHVSGGVSNLSFSFRGNNYLREAMHVVFLYHAQKKGMDFGIINPSTRIGYEDIPANLIQVIEKALLSPSPSSTDELLKVASLYSDYAVKIKDETENRTDLPVHERLLAALVKGSSEFLYEDLKEAQAHYSKAVDIIEGPLMEGMRRVGRLFGEGKMFLPQVVKTARTMKDAVSILQPAIEREKVKDKTSAGKVLMATVKGDVHDIGKNIVSLIMACNGFEVVDLGVMVPPEEIVRVAKETKSDLIGLSGLITPSLEEMVQVVRLLSEAGITVPVMIGGATTSALHTAVRIAPEYKGPVIWVKDASQNAPMAMRFLDPLQKDAAAEELKAEQQKLREQYSPQSELLSIEEARSRKPNFFS